MRGGEGGEGKRKRGGKKRREKGEGGGGGGFIGLWEIEKTLNPSLSPRPYDVFKKKKEVSRGGVRVRVRDNGMGRMCGVLGRVWDSKQMLDKFTQVT